MMGIVGTISALRDLILDYGDVTVKEIVEQDGGNREHLHKDNRI